MIDVVSRIIMSAMPSMPSVKRMPHDGIHDRSNAACHADTVGSNDHHSPIDTMNSTSSVMNAIHRGALAMPAAISSLPGATPRRLGVGVSQMTAAPTTGIASSAGSTQFM